MRKTPDADLSPSHRPLAIALVCAFAGCLNPLPEEYPSDTTPVEGPGAPGAASADPASDGAEENVAIAPDPASGEPINPGAVPPPSSIPPPPPDAGAPADAGPSDAGTTDAGDPANGD